VRAAAPRTTILSVAFLRSAAQGECDVAWQNFPEDGPCASTLSSIVQAAVAISVVTGRLIAASCDHPYVFLFDSLRKMRT
jgi:hypothetical protein